MNNNQTIGQFLGGCMMRQKTTMAMVFMAWGWLGLTPVLASSGSGSHWSYQGAEGPEHWGALGYETCSAGQNQSPINLAAAAPIPLDPLAFAHAPTTGRVVNNGHTIQVNLSPGNTLTVGGKSHDLLQFHFHALSEHTVMGNSFPMEMHLVHKSADNGLAVVGVMLKVGTESAALAPVFAAMSAEKGREVSLSAPLNPTELLPKGLEYFHYKGSLTTPPCSEGVSWFVLKEPVTISTQQLASFTALYAHNARPIQPLHGRILLSAGGASGPGAPSAGH